ncbi:MAG: site-specific integrase [Longimonas sp.]|uniref:tyrosine-type recombinase/integrase n=1 Tax=Longimonas sp. TaxID=2039626 RepID=UPI003976C5CD
MTILRDKMIRAMQQRGYSPRTQSCYLAAVVQLSRYFRRSPDALGIGELQRYCNYLVQERDLAPASCRQQYHGIRFFYLQVLQWPACDLTLVIPKCPQRIPALLTRDDVRRILQACSNDRHRMMLELCYGCGLRVSEVTRLRVSDIDGERSQLRIEQGKGARDRIVVLAPTLLQRLRGYWRDHRPRGWLFPRATDAREPIGVTTPQKAYRAAKRKAGVSRAGGIHGLRHAYATHMLEHGVPVHQLQRLLGHRSLQSTLHYLHWLPGEYSGTGTVADLMAGLAVRDD